MPLDGGPPLNFVAATGTFTAVGNGIAAPVVKSGDINASLWGTFVGTVVLERTFDSGTTWLPVTYIDGFALSWTAPMSSFVPCPERGVSYRFRCSAYTSGTINYRLSQG